MGKIEQLKSTFVDQQDVVGGSTFIPIGSIIAIHPLTINLPDITYWKECTGSGFLGDNFTGGGAINVPNLNDEVFLSGTTGTAVAMGGANTMYDHKHSHNSTDLALASGATGGLVLSAHTGGGVTNSTHGGSISGGAHHHHTWTLNSTTTMNIASLDDTHHATGGFAYIESDEGHGHTHSFTPPAAHVHSDPSPHTVTTDATVTTRTIEGTIGGSGTEDDVTADTIENRPKYFSVKYYIRTV